MEGERERGGEREGSLVGLVRRVQEIKRPAARVLRYIIISRLSLGRAARMAPLGSPPAPSIHPTGQ